MSAEQAVCARCGIRRRDEDDPSAALAWVFERVKGGVRWLCVRCARDHARDIEGKLPEEYW
ncbi:hypothetical protein ORV05_27965 [Amycolatopsis cynarae]|uniref:Uncharacterized protein n=1 Tax=Amycolatopsis cynarae TaxID=2995223 RepID=A0ABY7AZ63_9PSEU|nr:hypothetical protein ORV05_27965 [Amycolatopsis sp. HUAS 11-8]